MIGGSASNAPNAPMAVRPSVFCAVALALIFFTAPWPPLQAVFHVALVLGLAPLEAAPLAAALWALAAGWTLEGTMRLVPHPGGAAWADMTVALAVLFFNRYWPPDRRLLWWARLAGFTLLHALLMHGAVALASGAHVWGRGWLWALISSPFWAMLAWRLKRPAYPR